MISLLKFIYVEKTTKFCKISIVNLSYVVPVKFTVVILQNFVAFSEYMNFKGGFYSEGTDAFVISLNRRTLLFSWAWILKFLKAQIMSHKDLKLLWRFK